MTEVMPGMRRVANLEPISPTMIAASQMNQYYIFSVNPHIQISDLGSQRYMIPACPPMAEVSEPLIVPGLKFEPTVADADGFRTEYKWTTIEGLDLAKDILGTALGKDASNDLTRLGVFLSHSPVPAVQEVEQARARLHDHYGRLIQEADRAYELNGGQEVVNGVARSNIAAQHVEAAKAMGLDKPWARRNATAMVMCPACEEPVKPTAAICAHCDAILDEEKARKFFPHKFHEKRGPGRPPKEE